jgi:hypothetical protein
VDEPDCTLLVGWDVDDETDAPSPTEPIERSAAISLLPTAHIPAHISANSLTNNARSMV